MSHHCISSLALRVITSSFHTVNVERVPVCKMEKAGAGGDSLAEIFDISCVPIIRIDDYVPSIHFIYHFLKISIHCIYVSYDEKHFEFQMKPKK